VSDQILADALFALRDAAEPSAPSLDWAWRSVSSYLSRARPLPKERDRDDIRQRSLLKVLAGVRAMDADTPVRAIAWLKSVHRSAYIDHFRGAGDRELDRALDRTPKRDDGGYLERIPEPDADVEIASEPAVEAVLERAKERVHRWLADEVPRVAKRLGDYRRAEIALLANVRDKNAGEIRAELGLGEEIATATIYKWIERGREETLLPALENWDDPARAGVLSVLLGARRSDSGKARPERRRGRSVSSARTPTSKKRKKSDRAQAASTEGGPDRESRRSGSGKKRWPTH
jgi:hypothetical protein